MAEDGMPDFDLEGMLDWLYVEDDYPLADELAESQIPDPGYAGTKYELDMEELDDFDVFDYWDDLQYGDDSYWESASTRRESTLKRKRDTKTTSRTHEKRQRLALIDTAGDNVRFVSRITRNEMAMRTGPVTHQRKSFALFPDWRQRFANEDGAPLNKVMPAAMKHAAEGTYVEKPPKTSRPDVNHAQTNGVESVYDEDENGGDDMQIDLSSLDPETLKTILRQKLGDAGLDGMDENALMKMLGNMISGEAGADDVVDDLANDLVERATEGNDAALSGWLSQQGVSLDAAATDDDDTDSLAAPELPNAVNGVKEADKVKSSPSDSAIEMQKAVVGASTEMAMHPSSPSELVKKRAAPFAEAEAQEIRKRKRVSFDVATSSESITVARKAEKEEKHDQNPEEPLPLTSEIPPISDEMNQDTNEDDNIIVVQSRATNTAAVKKNGETNFAEAEEPKTTQAKQTSEPESQSSADDEQVGEEIVVAAPAPAKNTRKRKAEAEKSAPKKQAKKASAPAEAVGKRTRSTRAAARAGR